MVDYLLLPYMFLFRLVVAWLNTSTVGHTIHMQWR
jgi:hypothetical protein